MATKQAVANIKNAERARNTEPTFGKDSAPDPWRAAPSLAGLHQALQPYREVRGQGTSAPGDSQWDWAYRNEALAKGDRYGQNGGQHDDYNKPPAPEAQQAKEGIKGAEVGAYRVPISGVVQ
jgi:hypothetical protein